jgi:hypothetical protein
MAEWVKYLRVQGKRVSRLYPAILAFTAALVVALSTLLVGMLSDNAAQESKQKLPIGLVGDISDSYLGIGVFAVQNFDTSKYYLEFIEMPEAEAKEKLEAGDLMGYLRIPDGFVQSLINGENKKICYVAGNSPASVGPIMMEEIALIVSDLIMESQSGIYGFMDVADTVEIDRSTYYDMVEELNVEYIRRIFDRESAYEVHLIGVSAGLPFTEYYFCAFFLLLLMLCGTVCVHLLVKTDLALPRLLYCSGHSLPGQIAAEYLPYAGMMWLNTLLLFFGVGLVLPTTGMTLLSDVTTVGEWLGLGLRLLPAVMLITAMQVFFYELTSTIISGVLLQVLSTITLAYVSGFLYPLSSLPQSIQTLSGLLPTGVAFDYVSGAITGEGGALWVTLLYTLALLALTAVARLWRLRGVADD